eukprot:Amastigsp_a680415_64.p4 type:complete len:105 gc:universal Amastigsp_a680415_64:769-455(-)
MRGVVGSARDPHSPLPRPVRGQRVHVHCHGVHGHWLTAEDYRCAERQRRAHPRAVPASDLLLDGVRDGLSPRAEHHASRSQARQCAGRPRGPRQALGSRALGRV